MSLTERGLDELSKAEKAIRAYALCDNCLGRLFASLGFGLTNKERGFALKTVLLMAAYAYPQGIVDREIVVKLAETGFKPALAIAEKESLSIQPKKCYLCEGALEELDELAAMVVRALSEYEYETFLIGCSFPQDMIRREETLWRVLGVDTGELLKSEITREVGKRVQRITGKTYEPSNPDIVAIIDLAERKVRVEPSPLFIYGRYRKLARGLPQTPWPEGGGEEPSIQELIVRPIVEAAEAEDALFHAAGREDVDVRTLGRGRPFIVEVKRPKRRRLDLKRLETEINERARGMVEVEGLRNTARDMVSKIKAFAEIARKTYRARVVFREPVEEDDARKLEEYFRKVQIKQRTPLRVLHRRRDRVRVKTVYSVKAEKTGDRELVLTIECQGGLYVKEFIHGDSGRTTPSVAEVLGKDVESISLDIIDIEEYLGSGSGEKEGDGRTARH